MSGTTQACHSLILKQVYKAVNIIMSVLVLVKTFPLIKIIKIVHQNFHFWTRKQSGFWESFLRSEKQMLLKFLGNIDSISLVRKGPGRVMQQITVIGIAGKRAVIKTAVYWLLVSEWMLWSYSWTHSSHLGLLTFILLYYSWTIEVQRSYVMYLVSQIVDNWSEKWKWNSLSSVWLFSTPWTIQCMEFSRPEYWSGE